MKPKQQAVMAKTNGHCWYCGHELIIPTAEMAITRENFDAWLHMDHVVAKTLGGSNHIDNLIPACWRCNCTKGDKSVEQYRLYLAIRETGMPYFNREQLEWLLKMGFQMPDTKPVVFWAEQKEAAQS